MEDEKRQAKTPEDIAELSGGDVDEIRAAFESVRIIQDGDDEMTMVDGIREMQRGNFSTLDDLNEESDE